MPRLTRCLAKHMIHDPEQHVVRVGAGEEEDAGAGGEGGPD